MIRLGVLGTSDRVVLLDGRLVETAARGVRRVGATREIYLDFLGRLPAGWTAFKGDPIALPDGPEGDSEPEPDVTVVRGTGGDYRERHPSSDDIALVVEVADGPTDDRKMLARYGWAGVPEVWIVDLKGETVTVASGPTGPGPGSGYRDVVARGFDEELTVRDGEGRPLATLRIADVLGAGAG